MVMRVQILSDLHLEFEGNTIPRRASDADAVILAGDLAPVRARRVNEIAKRWADAEHIFYVPGNHEFYGSEIDEARLELARACNQCDISLLDPGAVTVGEVRFIGATLWTDFRLGSGPAEEALAHFEVGSALSDFVGAIRHGGSRLSTHETARRHELERAFIERELEVAGREGLAAVVITHHAPSPRCIRPWYEGNRLNPGFASDLDRLIARHQPHLWVHGHMHDRIDVMLGDTRILANPYGYGPAEGRDFDPALVIDLPLRREPTRDPPLPAADWNPRHSRPDP